MPEPKTDQLRHTDFAQANVTRMAHYSFVLKVWCFTLVLAFFGVLIGERDAFPWFWTLPLPLIFCSWGLDAYFLGREGQFKVLYSKAARDACEANTASGIFPDASSLARSAWRHSLLKHTVWPIYSAQILTAAAVGFLPHQTQSLQGQHALSTLALSLLPKTKPVDSTLTVMTPSVSFEARFAQIVREATPEQRYRFLYALPKAADLHNHLNLSILPEAWLQAAAKAEKTHDNVFYTRTRLSGCKEAPDPPVLYRTLQRSSYQRLSDCQRAEYEPLATLSVSLKEQWLSALKLDRPGEGRDEFFEVLSTRLGDLGRDPYLVTDVLVDNMKRFGTEGVRYMEVQVVGPKFLDKLGTPIDEERAVQLLRERLNQPDARATGVSVRFLASVVRFLPGAEQDLERAFALVSRHRDLWVGVNLTGREDKKAGNAERFLGTFRRLRRTYGDVSLALHGGESEAPGTQIRDTLLLGATRIGHALNLTADPTTLLLMRDGKYLIETNLISNRLLGYIPDLSEHPFAEYLRLGIPVCLNTDDRGALDSNLTDEYYTAVTTFNLRWDELNSLGRNSLRYSFADATLKAELLRRYDEAVQQFEDTYRAGDWRETVARVHPFISGYAGRTWERLVATVP